MVIEVYTRYSACGWDASVCPGLGRSLLKCTNCHSHIVRPCEAIIGWVIFGVNFKARPLRILATDILGLDCIFPQTIPKNWPAGTSVPAAQFFGFDGDSF